MLTVKEFKEWVNKIPDEYDDVDVGICFDSIDGSSEIAYTYDIEGNKMCGTYYLEIYEREIKNA